eukprot:m.303998 g.303998  ORF g.303998 m.303998 type:complete len:458 (+) comp20171_c1_seq1:348-1721(+)
MGKPNDKKQKVQQNVADPVPAPPDVLPSMSASPPETAAPRSRRRRAKAKAPSVPDASSLNWLLHEAYLKRNFSVASALCDEQLSLHHGRSEQALFVKAMVCRQQGNIEESLELFKKAMYLNPHNPNNAKQVARTLFLLSRFHSAIEVYDQILAANVRDWHVLHNRAVCLSFIGRLDDAVEEMTKALSMHKHDASFMQLGKYCLMQGRVHDAIAVFTEALMFSPENADLFTMLGILHLNLGETPKAFDLFGRALTYNPKDTKAILGAGSVIQECGDYDVALRKYRVPAATAPDSAETWNNIGMCFYGLGKEVAAISCLKHAAYLNPFEWKTQFNLGLAHMKVRQYASAFQFLSAASNFEPDFADTYMLLGSALLYLDDAANARAAFEKATSLAPTDPTIALNYAIALYADQDFAGAAAKLAIYEANRSPSASDDAEKELQQAADKLSAAIQLGDVAMQ